MRHTTPSSMARPVGCARPSPTPAPRSVEFLQGPCCAVQLGLLALGPDEGAEELWAVRRQESSKVDKSAAAPLTLCSRGAPCSQPPMLTCCGLHPPLGCRGAALHLQFLQSCETSSMRLAILMSSSARMVTSVSTCTISLLCMVCGGELVAEPIGLTATAPAVELWLLAVAAPRAVPRVVPRASVACVPP